MDVIDHAELMEFFDDDGKEFWLDGEVEDPVSLVA